MKYAIIGFGNLGQSLARAFARKNIEAAVASRHSAEALEPQARAIGPAIISTPLHDALKADIVLLAVPFAAHEDVANAAASWQGKIVIDATNAFGVPPEQLGGLPSSAVVARAFTGARVVKAFNHLPARTFAEDPSVNGGRRVVFLSSDDEDAAARVAVLVEQLGFAPIMLGKLAEGGLLVGTRGDTWAELIFEDLVKIG